MFKVVITDDEKRTVEGLKRCIDWAKYDLEIVGQANDGLQALSIIRQARPDIVLSDVRMPKMDGIKLSKLIKEEFPETKVIFISGHSDLSYIKSAFKHDVTDYILKPVDPDELEAVIQKVSNQCKITRQVNESRKALETKIHQSMPLLQDKFLSLLVSGELKKQEDILERLAFLDIDIHRDGIYSVLVLNIDDYYQTEQQVSLFEKELTAFSLCNIVNEIMSDHACGVIFKYKDNEFVSIVSFSCDTDESVIEETVEDIAQTIKDKLNTYLHLSVTIGVGNWIHPIKEVASSYKHAMYAVNQKLLVGKNKVYYVDVAKHEESLLEPVDSAFLDRLFIGLRHGDFEIIRQTISRLFRELSENHISNRQSVLSLCLQLFSVANRVEIELGPSGLGDLAGLHDTYQSLFHQETLQDFEKYTLAVFERICDSIRQLHAHSSNKTIDEIKSMIHEQYGKELTVNGIAKAIYLTPSYICLLFKQETGETINNYLTRYRMEKARDMLQESPCKLSEVSRQVGYTDAKYFSKIFKKYTGINPSEFRAP